MKTHTYSLRENGSLHTKMLSVFGVTENDAKRECINLDIAYDFVILKMRIYLSERSEIWNGNSHDLV